MKTLNISKGLLFIGVAYAFQANAAVIEITEDRLTTNASVWFFEDSSPSFPPSGNTILNTNSKLSQGPMLGLNSSINTQAYLDFQSVDRVAWSNANLTNSGNGFGILLVTDTVNMTNNGGSAFDYGYGEAAWASASRFTVNGSGASLELDSYLGGGSGSAGYADISFELFNETEMLTLASVDCSSAQICSGDFSADFTLLDGNSYAFTSFGYLRSSGNQDNGPILDLRFYNADRVTVPEPSTALLLLLGALGMGWILRERGLLGKN